MTHAAGAVTYVHRALELFAGFGDREALVRRERRLTYSELRTAVLDLASAMRANDVRSGMSVVVLVARPFEAPILQLALHLLGARSVWIDLGMPRRDLTEYLRLVGPELVIYDARTHDDAGRELAGSWQVPALCLGEGGVGPDLLAPAKRHAEVAEFGPVATAPSAIFQTSGTTGTPKLIHHTERFYLQALDLARELVEAGERGTRHLSISGLSYLAGQISCFIYLFSGGVLFLLEGFEADEFLDTVARERIESTFLAPPGLYAVLDHPRLAETDTSSMRLFSVGAAPASTARLRQAIAHFGPVVRITYGLSECPFISANPGLTEQHGELLASCGRPYGDVEVQLRAPDGAVLPDGETGELWVRSRLAFAGYWGQPELTEDTVVDGWVRTHDLGYRDRDGYLFIVGRNQDMIIAGDVSMKIFPRPIEEVLTTHPQVRAAAVCGMPDPEFVEVAHAFVVLADGATVTESDLVELIADQLDPAWVPSRFHVVDALPLTPTGKVNTSALRNAHAAGDPVGLLTT